MLTVSAGSTAHGAALTHPLTATSHTETTETPAAEVPRAKTLVTRPFNRKQTAAAHNLTTITAPPETPESLILAAGKKHGKIADAVAKTNQGVAHWTGRGATVNPEKAMQLFHEGASLGDVAAAHNLGVAHWNQAMNPPKLAQSTTAESTAQSLRWFGAAAIHGDDAAKHLYAAYHAAANAS